MSSALYKARNPVRFVTAAALFDGHDASINIIRRLLQAAGCEVIHLGHNRSVDEIVTAAIQEDAQGIAVSSYQGGHVEFLKYMKDLLRDRGAEHVKIFAGGGGTIVPREIDELRAYGIDRIFSPEDGRRLGLEGMISTMVEDCDFDPMMLEIPRALAEANGQGAPLRLARRITFAERDGDRSGDAASRFEATKGRADARAVPVVGLTGPGGAGKSSYTDELIRRFLLDFPDLRLGVLSVDPTKRTTGGALLGDRIRMNSIYSDRVFMRSLATRGASSSLSAALSEAIQALKDEGFDLVLVETSGIGQGESSVVDLVDLSVYVMTPEYGAASQLEKIDMLDLANLVVVNKFDRRGAEDALRDVRKQFRRARGLFHEPADEALPVFGCISAQFNDEGVTASYQALLGTINEKAGTTFRSQLPAPSDPVSRSRNRMIPPARQNYLSEVAETVRSYRRWAEEQVRLAARHAALENVLETFADASEEVKGALQSEAEAVRQAMDPRAREALGGWDALVEAYSQDELVFHVRGRELRSPLVTETLSGTKLPRVAPPRRAAADQALRYLLLENVPGSFPYTAGVFPLKRADEDPKRMFAGEGGPARTNERFHYLCAGETAKRLSTAFDSVTLYGQDPDERPDIFGKIGESGVSICTLDDMKRLYQGFDLVDKNTSVSMTINGPAPIILAMFLNTAIDQQVDAFAEREGRLPNPAEHQEITAKTLTTVRGTVQADILKEDQAQNTCIFSTEFALRMMGDIQQYFTDNEVRNYYSVSISGYHIAEAGANPISQLAFTLANAFTYVEYYLARGMAIDDFAPNLSFFFSNGLDAEYTVLGRVARRIWSLAIRDLHGGNERSQKLKYHIQTSGRSLHAQEVDFNDIRTTLQALLALQDHCNSLHTNAYDEAITTPTAESVRRAMAIQMIITKEYGIAKNENVLQGSYVIDELTDLVEEAVLQEFERISDRGGVLGAMETQYQRGRIQEESLLYERLKHSGELPIVGVNTFINDQVDHEAAMNELELTRATHDEKHQRIAELRAFQDRHAEPRPEILRDLQRTALEGGNIFASLMRAVRVASLGQISRALFDVGGAYRRNM